MIHRLLLALLGCLLALAAPASGHTPNSLRPLVPPPLALFAVEFIEPQDCGPLTLHLDGLHDRAGPCRGVLVRQNPWSAFDPEGLESFMFPPQYAQSREFRQGFDESVARNFKGFFVDGPVNMVKGLASLNPFTLAKRSVQETVAASKHPGGFIAGLNEQAAQKRAAFGSEMKRLVTTPEGSGEIMFNIATLAVGGAELKASAVTKAGEAEALTVTQRARHYTSPENLAKIKASEELLPARGGGVHVETGPPFGSPVTGQAETGAHAGGAYVEFDATAPMKPTTAGVNGRQTAVIPTEKPLPLKDLNPVYKKTPWWKVW